MGRGKKIVYIAAAVVIGISAWQLYQFQAGGRATEDKYSALAENVHGTEEATSTGSQMTMGIHAAETPTPGAVGSASGMDGENGFSVAGAGAGSSAGNTADAAAGGAAGETSEDTVGVTGESGAETNAQIASLKEKNPDTVGWITIPGTAIDYPIMQRKSDVDFYLDHDFDSKNDIHGVPFLDAGCRMNESGNLIIYGHHMKDGTMFRDLMKYQDASFCEENPTITLTSERWTASYRIFAVLVMSEADREIFPYYKYIQFQNEKEWNTFLDGCQTFSTWMSESIPSFGDQLVTLSTCEYSTEDGRLVVIASEE